MVIKQLKSWVLSISLLSLSSLALAQSSVRLRGVVEKIDASTLTFKERSGEVLTLQLPALSNEVRA